MRSLFGSPKERIEKKLIAHRGANNMAIGNVAEKLPENSILALRQGLSLGVAVELDVIRLKCGTFVVFHDDTLERLGRYNPAMATTLTKPRFKEMCQQPLTTLTYEEVSQVDVGNYDEVFEKKYVGTKIPTLQDFLSELRFYPSGKVVIELKHDDVAIVDSFVEAINLLVSKYYLHDRQLIFISFDFPIIKALKIKLPMYKQLLLTTASTEEKEYAIKTKADLAECIVLVKEANLDGLDVECADVIDREFVEMIHAAQLKMFVWNYPQYDNLIWMEKLLEMGVDAINTNQPDYIIKNIHLFLTSKVPSI